MQGLCNCRRLHRLIHYSQIKYMENSRTPKPDEIKLNKLLLPNSVKMATTETTEKSRSAMNNTPPHIVKSHLVWIANIVRPKTTSVVRATASNTCDIPQPNDLTSIFFCIITSVLDYQFRSSN